VMYRSRAEVKIPAQEVGVEMKPVDWSVERVARWRIAAGSGTESVIVETVQAVLSLQCYCCPRYLPATILPPPVNSNSTLYS
jgi:hypothetical protein